MKKIPNYKYLYVLADITTIFTSFLITIYIVRRDYDKGFFELIFDARDLLLVFFGLSLLFLIIFKYNGLYRINIILSRAAHLVGILKSIYYGALQVAIISLFLEGNTIVDSRLIIFVFILVIIPFLYLVRVEFLRSLFTTLSKHQLKRNVLIIGDGKSGRILATKLLFENPLGIDIVGFVDNNLPVGTEIVSGKIIVGKTDELEELVRKYNIHELLIAIENNDYEQFLDVIDTCKNLNLSVRITSELFDVVAQKLSTEKYGEIPVIDVSPHYNNAVTLGLKRIFDLVGASIIIILFSPLMLLIALLVKLSSPGPVLFKQKRIGKYGREFDFYKFRSMYVLEGEDEERKEMMINFMKNDSATENDKKVINDKRVTWIGKIIRKTSLDELPQLFNVIIGDMSLVGPRPCLPYEYENYDDWQKRRVSVTPGCTGVWQVWGRSSVSFKDSVVLDLYYINNMSPWFDLQLLFQTIPVLVLLKGAK